MQNLVSEVVVPYQWDIQFFLVKNFKPCLDIMSELFSVNRDIIFVHPIGVENWSLQCVISVYIWKMANCNFVDIFVSP